VLGFVPADVIRLKRDAWFSKLNSDKIDKLVDFLCCKHWLI